MSTAGKSTPFLLPNAGHLITLAHAGRLDLLLRPGWPLRLVVMVLYEPTRHDTPSREAINGFIAHHGVPVPETGTCCTTASD